MSAAFAPLVTAEERVQWEEYSVANQRTVIFWKKSIPFTAMPYMVLSRIMNMIVGFNWWRRFKKRIKQSREKFFDGEKMEKRFQNLTFQEP